MHHHSPSTSAPPWRPPSAIMFQWCPGIDAHRPRAALAGQPRGGPGGRGGRARRRGDARHHRRPGRPADGRLDRRRAGRPRPDKRRIQGQPPHLAAAVAAGRTAGDDRRPRWPLPTGLRHSVFATGGIAGLTGSGMASPRLSTFPPTWSNCPGRRWRSSAPGQEHPRYSPYARNPRNLRRAGDRLPVRCIPGFYLHSTGDRCRPASTRLPSGATRERPLALGGPGCCWPRRVLDGWP